MLTWFLNLIDSSFRILWTNILILYCNFTQQLSIKSWISLCLWTLREQSSFIETSKVFNFIWLIYYLNVMCYIPRNSKPFIISLSNTVHCMTIAELDVKWILEALAFFNQGIPTIFIHLCWHKWGFRILSPKIFKSYTQIGVFWRHFLHNFLLTFIEYINTWIMWQYQKRVKMSINYRTKSRIKLLTSSSLENIGTHRKVNHVIWNDCQPTISHYSYMNISIFNMIQNAIQTRPVRQLQQSQPRTSAKWDDDMMLSDIVQHSVLWRHLKTGSIYRQT